ETCDVRDVAATRCCNEGHGSRLPTARRRHQPRAEKGLRWKPEPDDGDYAAAASYLALVLPATSVRTLVARLRRARTTRFKPKDVERASGVKLLPPDDPEVESKPRKSKAGKPLSPVLLVRGSLEDGRQLIIADGYHRICASYHVDREAEIPCRIVPL